MTLKDVARMTTGIGLVVLGIAGLILPIMPGWIFLIPGLLILADYFPPIHRLVLWLKARFRDAEEELRRRRAGENDEPSAAETQSSSANESSSSPKHLASDETKRPQ